ncbi:amino acid permease [Aminipila butyrica]|uniref:Amino acid permease n=1 Tax=Aminipila butyrica TaxID=433296 RepID=A0A858BVP9_9FIRM|nr:basic amino acid/polyamine antiporter [Aminipila butyrica]QIB70131.1 amino acid permease [Aminipila butyrica]
MKDNSLDQTRTLGTLRLTMFAIGTTLASGVFSLSGDFAAGGAHTLAVLIGWLICGVGMLGLCMCFFQLSVRKPEMTSGIYNYAKHGFGDYIGFNAAWGYWMSAILAQIAFVTLFFSALSYFFPVFGSGSNFISILCGSAFIWLLALLILKGVNEAVTINVIVVIAKLLPILVMVVAIIVARAFDLAVFMENFSGSNSDMSLLEQVKSTAYVTVWLFIGIEGSVVISGRAKSTAIAGRATVISFLCLLALYLMISMLSMGVLTQSELAELGNPPMAGVLAAVVGPWGAAFVNIAVIISLGGAMFTYSILSIDSGYGPALSKCFPQMFTKLNKNNSPVVSVIITTLIVQMFLIIVYFNESSYQACYTLSTSAIMFPYIFSALYFLKINIQGDGLENASAGERAKSWFFAIIGTIYGAWLLYASGVTYILISSLLYGPGILLYLYTRKEQKVALLPSVADKATFVIMVSAFLLSIVMLYNKTIQPF